MPSTRQESAFPFRSVPGTPQHEDAEQVTKARDLVKKLLVRPGKNGRYRFIRELARGGMGIIYLVEDQDLRRISAMKIIPNQIVDMEKKFNSFIAEARITAELEHPNIIPVHEIGILEQNGCPYYTMKKVEGESLVDIIDKLAAGDPAYSRRFTRYRLLDIFRKICDAVAYSHSRGIIHRDLKPENIMVGRFGEVLLMDWGLAKHLKKEDTDKTPLAEAENSPSPPSREPEPRMDFMQTEDGMIKGSLAYISPEQVFGDVDEIDETTDIFLLGATLYHMFTYAPPYQAEDMISLIDMAERCDFPPPSVRAPNAQIPRALERIILHAMAPLKKNRFSSVEQLIDELDAFIAGRRVCDRRVFARGEDLIVSGEAGAETYILINGSVEVHSISHGKKLVIATLGPGDIVGEMASITHHARSASVTALETTEVLVITAGLMHEELEKLPPWMEKIVFSMADRVRLLDTHVHPFLYTERVFPIINQLYAIFNQRELTPESVGTVSFHLDHIIDELYINLGINQKGTEPLLKIMIHSGLCTQDNEGNISVPDLDLLRSFGEYCRWKQKIANGVKQIETMKLPSEQEPYFRNILRKLRQAAEQTGPPSRQ